MLKKELSENVDTGPIGTGPYVLQQYKVDSLIRYVANPELFSRARCRRSISSSPLPQTWKPRLAKLQTNECQIIPATLVQFDVIKNNST